MDIPPPFLLIVIEKNPIKKAQKWGGSTASNPVIRAGGPISIFLFTIRQLIRKQGRKPYS